MSSSARKELAFKFLKSQSTGLSDAELRQAVEALAKLTKSQMDEARKYALGLSTA